MRPERQVEVGRPGRDHVVLIAVGFRTTPAGVLEILQRDVSPGAGTESTEVVAAFAPDRWWTVRFVEPSE